ncbi:uncharacterized protein TRAVEDRAFT_53911 [Trametes versicolor FP-101664 SS1]|uniref:Fungal-type protein kinase domain-containing protein n=1 Tax=Trametes versicolor (strain FP-101664) TaxID=717944 RepID=R7S7F8_TRAVS|nr:uncharacterized protein TRAVEDRAFT_53911 [Trametes versicolor FP-101664 SS1]EIW51916.1 hypothetical protein TRAVEDRAFT_53911 [Trametes versicolor FP-101664 SS1]
MTNPSPADPPAATPTDPVPAMPASDAGGPSPDHTQTDGEAAPPPPMTRPSRVRAVSPRALSEMKNGRELVWAVLCALIGHKEIYEQADGELHGDINPNSIVLLDHPGDARPWDQPGRTAGAMIYWEAPISIQTARKVGEVRDRPVPPPQQRRAMPPWACGYRWEH